MWAHQLGHVTTDHKTIYNIHPKVFVWAQNPIPQCTVMESIPGISTVASRGANARSFQSENQSLNIGDVALFSYIFI